MLRAWTGPSAYHGMIATTLLYVAAAIPVGTIALITGHDTSGDHGPMMDELASLT